MPGGDRTGPLGKGPRTGRAAGYCAGYNVPGAMIPALGGRGGADLGGRWQVGWGQGRPAGRGRLRSRFPGWGAPWGWDASWNGDPGWRRGTGWGRGANWSRRWGDYPPVEIPDASEAILVNLKNLERQLEALDSEIAEIRQVLQAGGSADTGGQE